MIGESFTVCGTERRCEECPIVVDRRPSEYGRFNGQYSEAERLGAAAENLDSSLLIGPSITPEQADAVVESIGIYELDSPSEKLRKAVETLGTQSCKDHRTKGE